MEIKELRWRFACQISNNEKAITLSAAGLWWDGAFQTRPSPWKAAPSAKYDILRFLEVFIPFD